MCISVWYPCMWHSLIDVGAVNDSRNEKKVWLQRLLLSAVPLGSCLPHSGVTGAHRINHILLFQNQEDFCFKSVIWCKKVHTSSVYQVSNWVVAVVGLRSDLTAAIQEPLVHRRPGCWVPYLNHGAVRLSGCPMSILQHSAVPEVQSKRWYELPLLLVQDK